mgnify:CR=1 FL=1
MYIVGVRDTPNGPQVWVEFEDGSRWYRVLRADGVKWRTPLGNTLQSRYAPPEHEVDTAIKRAKMRG